MERHRVKDAERPARRSKDEHVKPLKAEELVPVSSAVETRVGNVQDDVKPGETKRLVLAYGPPFPRKKVSAVKTAGPAKNPAKNKKESAAKPVGRPVSPGRKKKSERSLS
jgi:hypothetical protein